MRTHTRQMTLVSAKEEDGAEETEAAASSETTTTLSIAGEWWLLPLFSCAAPPVCAGVLGRFLPGVAA